jgi:hypothetical protein
MIWTVGRSAAFVFGLGVLCSIGCGSSTAPTSDPAPTPTTVRIAGTWEGAASDSSGPGSMTWTLTQDNAEIKGTATVSTTLKTVVLTGTISGSISGSVVTWRIDVPPGGVKGFSTCTVKVNGTATVAGNASALNGTYSGEGLCMSAFTNGTIALTKQ